MRRPPIYGLMAEFADLQDLVDATKAARDAGYHEIDAFTPFPSHELSEILGFHHNRLPLLVLIGGIVGMIAGYSLCYWTSVIDYPINVAGRPIHSWPSFIPITFECTVLGAALTTVFGMLALNGLPMPYHPVFNVPRFALSSRDKFFLCIEATDPLFDAALTQKFLERLVPLQISEVEH